MELDELIVTYRKDVSKEDTDDLLNLARSPVRLYSHSANDNSLYLRGVIAGVISGVITSALVSAFTFYFVL